MGSKHHEQRQKQHGKGDAINPRKAPPRVQDEVVDDAMSAADEAEVHRHERGEALEDERMSSGTPARRPDHH